MNAPLSEFLVISRGEWDPGVDKNEIEASIGKFYEWLQGCIDEGTMRMGSRLGPGGALVSKDGVLTDGPFGEGKEVIGGYWFILASSLSEAAELLSKNPVIPHGIHFEVRPLDPERASVFKETVEARNLR